MVARGFEADSSQMRTDSPACGRQSFRLVLTIAVSSSWKINSLGISAAFLQGDVLERDVYSKPPTDICPSSEVWKLKRCIYGLNDASRAWYKKVKKEMLRWRKMS